ncbi:Predicted DNA-binding transcriptional regulator YafY, contains an HTH and WYL domains [Amycolatopsis tolypomycina]|uniref:Predicted DNA-binding transcriptional regulator YafY, contains an HTH and WYL domains n=1 Tax=Amycolatopsis tolypomycina TaxID=208445 RepID=A0A1H5DKI3_9PSEU|nr:YafY family protein [Amycolatopsis tolypomycina]SED79341.1 Predicted DNA-binding transcriptional regulator YafY, contains an HTH and WYL domains [Amycolatopsis tolypomycina]
MKAERLVALLFTLQRRRSATAAELASELGVSERTMHRDLAALRDAGVPLWTEQGRHGGFRLVDGWRSGLDGLTAREAVALFALGVPSALAGLGLDTAGSAARAKVAAGMPAELREHAALVAGRFHLDAPGWFGSADEPPSLATVAQAVWAQRRVSVAYRRRDKVAERELEPLGLVLKAGVWYLVARVVPDDALRTYRVSRILSAAQLDEAFERPPDFDLAAWWRASSATFEQVARPLRVRARLNRTAVRELRRVFGGEHLADTVVSLGTPDADGWADAELALEGTEIGVGQLVALSPGVEVLEPAEVRAALAAIGAELAARNAQR